MGENSEKNKISNYVDQVIEKIEFAVDDTLSDFALHEIYKETGKEVYTINTKQIAEAIAKQTAKKPIPVYIGEKNDLDCLPCCAWVCPVCQGQIYGQTWVRMFPQMMRPNYCDNCGQKLDWSEVE